MFANDAPTTGFTNGLNAAEEEMLQITEEECAELIQAISKVRRHGSLEDDEFPNSVNLHEEAGDVLACIAVLTHNKILDVSRVNAIARQKLDRLKVPGNRRVHYITPEMIP